MTATNGFLAWLVPTHGKADTPVGDLARELNHAYGVPSSGSLRRWMAEDMVVEPWMLAAYDLAWAEYTAKDCSAPSCAARAAGGASSFCQSHGGRRHQAGGSA